MWPPDQLQQGPGAVGPNRGPARSQPQHVPTRMRRSQVYLCQLAIDPRPGMVDGQLCALVPALNPIAPQDSVFTHC